MRRLKRMTIMLPLAVVLVGVLVPVVWNREVATRPADAASAQARVSGRTAQEWADAAGEALARGDFRRALRCIKTAETIEPGEQYAEDLAGVRRARWRASELARAGGRFLGGDVEQPRFRDDGSVLEGHRRTVVLPGESLWTLARAMVGARRGVPAAEVPGSDGDVHAAWDALTALNGVRELEVGESVMLPLSSVDVAALEAANREDLDRLQDAVTALSAGDVDAAERLRGNVVGAFALGTNECAALDEKLAAAIRQRTARHLREQALSAADTHRYALAESLASESAALGGEPSLVDEVRTQRLAWEEELVNEARLAVERAARQPRATAHGERLRLLEAALEALSRAETLRERSQYSDEAQAVSRMLAEESRFGVADDGTVLALKPAGATYTETARAAVEWLLERSLTSSGAAFPHHARKTKDEIAWAGYLISAAAAARRSGEDFADLLTAVDAELDLRLPDPTGHFSY